MEKHPAEQSKDLIGQALAAVQEDEAAESALGLLASSLANAQSNLFEAAKYAPDHPVSVKDMKKAMEFLARALQLLQDLDFKSKSVEVASGADTLTFTPEHAGAYRAEVRLTPTHLAPYLGPEASAALLQTPVVWIYANPVYVVE